MTVATRVLCYVAGGLGAVALLTGISRNYWASKLPDAAHSYGVTFRDGTELFFAPVLGWLLDHALWIFFGLFLTALVVEWLTGGRGKGAQGPPPHEAQDRKL